MLKIIFSILLSLMLVSCASMNGNIATPGQEPYVVGTSTEALLRSIPPLHEQPVITIAVYGFPDLTGQRKPSTKFSQLSMAVSQGTDVWVIQALMQAANGKMFKVVERGGLDNLVKERQLIRSTREMYDGDATNRTVLKPLLFAGLIVEGGIIGYDSNVESGGDGARYFGIGVHEEYRVDQVTVSMRFIAVQTGEIILTQEATKTIASYRTGADAFRFLDLNTKALELETGVATNEPVNYAIRSAIEFALHEIIMLGEKEGFWKFKYNTHDY